MFFCGCFTTDVIVITKFFIVAYLLTVCCYRSCSFFISQPASTSSNSLQQQTIEDYTTSPPNESPFLSPPPTDHVMRDVASFVSDVSVFYNQPDLRDISLRVGDTVYHGHKFVLAKSRDVFRTMLYEKNWSNLKVKTEMELDETEECRSVFDRFAQGREIMYFIGFVK